MKKSKKQYGGRPKPRMRRQAPSRLVPANICAYCGKKHRYLPFRCKFCGSYFCPDHYLPENHKCLGLEGWKANRMKEFREGKAPITYMPGIPPRYPDFSEIPVEELPRTFESRLPKTPHRHVKKKINIGKIARIVAIFASIIFIGFFILFISSPKPEHYYLSVNSRQQGAELIISGETNLPDNSELEISVPSLDVSGSVVVENGHYEWRVQCPINVPSGNIQIIISSPLKNFENSATTYWVRVNNPPTPDFTYSRDAHTVEFVDNSSDSEGTIVSWEWEFGVAGGVSNVQNPTFTYDSRGIYEVRLIATDNGGAQATCTKTIAIPDTVSYTWTYGGRSWHQEIEIIDEIEKYETMSHAVYIYGISPIGAYLPRDAKKFVTADDEKIEAFAENLKASYLSLYPISEDGLADFVLRFVQEAISYYEPGTKDNLYYWPYALEVLVAGKGNCTDKSILYASLIEALEYHACLVDLEQDSHMMVGVRLSERPSMASAAGYINKVVASFDTNGVEYWPAETTIPGWNLGERVSGLHTDVLSMDILPITEPPVASASATPVVGEVPLEVSFFGSGTDSDGNIISYSWDFDDGSTSNEQNPVHIFQNEGNFNVRFTVVDDDGETDSEWGIEITAIDISGGEWVKVADYSGTFDETTDTFRTWGDKFKIEYSLIGDSEYGYWNLFIYPENETLSVSRISVDFSDYNRTAISNISYCFEGAGSYYCEVGAANLDSWNITIFDWQKD